MKKFRMCARNNLRRGGGSGSSYSFGAAVVPGYPEVLRAPSCGSPGGMRGGRYASDFESGIVTGPRGAYVPIHAVSCDQKGGAGEVEEMRTAGYSFSPSSFVGATGSPIGLSLPVNGRSCGGSRRKARKARKTYKRIMQPTSFSSSELSHSKSSFSFTSASPLPALTRTNVYLHSL